MPQNDTKKMLDAIQIDPRHALDLEAYICRIDAALADPGEFLPGRAATRLLERIVAAGARVKPIGENAAVELAFLMVSATSTGTPHALLRNWQAAAKDRLAGAG